MFMMSSDRPQFSELPSFLKKSGRQEAYVPQVISLGPYHHTKAQLRAMDKHKGKAYRRMTRRRFKCNNYSAHMDRSPRAEGEIVKLDCDIRESYEEKFDCGAEELAMMLCLDGFFILEILRTLGGDKLAYLGASNCYEPIFERDKINYTGLDILNDILKLENQVPLIVLQKLLQLERLNSNDVEGELFRCLVNCPNNKLYPFNYDVVNWRPQNHHEQLAPDHLLGLFHSLIVSAPCSDDDYQNNVPDNTLSQPLIGSPQCDQTGSAAKRIPRAVKLRNAGMKLKACNGGIKGIKFDSASGTICLPPITITNHTEVLLRNMIALEVCKPSEINYVTCYVSLMDELIDSAEDVSVLAESNVVVNYLGSDAEVSKLFNALGDGVTESQTDPFKEMKWQVHKQYKSKFKVWSAELATKHFSSPWKCLALVGAILALLLTLLQTIYSIIAVYK